MAATNLNIRIDEDLKKEAELLFSDLGLNMTTAITIFLRSAVNYNGIPFEIRKPEGQSAAAHTPIDDDTLMALSRQLKKLHPVSSPVSSCRSGSSDIPFHEG